MKTDCCIVRDILPLYVENMVSDETAVLVKEHLSECKECGKEAEYLTSDNFIPVIQADLLPKESGVAPLKKVAKKFNMQMQSMSYALIILFVFLGLSITAGSDMMYNSLIMPAVGVFGYCSFRLKALYKLPILLLFIEAFAFVFKMVETDFYSLFVWSFIYYIFIFAGVAIAYLLHFALRKE